MTSPVRNEINTTKKYLLGAALFFGTITPFLLVKSELLIHPASNFWQQSIADIWALPIPVIIFLCYRLNNLKERQKKNPS